MSTKSNFENITRRVIIDIMRNPGSTRDQVRYRLYGESPVQVNRAIEAVVLAGHAVYSADRLEITRQGMQSLYPARVVRGERG
jgi:hypothetical protein